MRIRFLSRRYSSLNFLKFRIILNGSFGRRKDFLSECFFGNFRFKSDLYLRLFLQF
ncbi:hypothetical protein LEP1GSC066_0791 [Leptospira sp. serovar Kenya str. Sh9]|nr:hypothetical protein LEP1GSC066_0791 [Leptospira sp. serovar Kenya str. Sh9]